MEPRVFLSYNSADREEVDRILVALEAEGLATYIDHRDLPPGQPAHSNLEREITSALAMLVFIGPHGYGPYQEGEKDLGLHRQTRDRQLTSHPFPVIPVWLPGCLPPLDLLHNNSAVDLRHDGTTAPDLRSLLTELKKSTRLRLVLAARREHGRMAELDSGAVVDERAPDPWRFREAWCRAELTDPEQVAAADLTHAADVMITLRFQPDCGFVVEHGLPLLMQTLELLSTADALADLSLRLTLRRHLEELRTALVEWIKYLLDRVAQDDERFTLRDEPGLLARVMNLMLDVSSRVPGYRGCGVALPILVEGAPTEVTQCCQRFSLVRLPPTACSDLGLIVHLTSAGSNVFLDSDRQRAALADAFWYAQSVDLQAYFERAAVALLQSPVSALDADLGQWLDRCLATADAPGAPIVARLRERIEAAIQPEAMTMREYLLAIEAQQGSGALASDPDVARMAQLRELLPKAYMDSARSGPPRWIRQCLSRNLEWFPKLLAHAQAARILGVPEYAQFLDRHPEFGTAQVQTKETILWLTLRGEALGLESGPAPPLDSASLLRPFTPLIEHLRSAASRDLLSRFDGQRELRVALDACRGAATMVQVPLEGGLSSEEHRTGTFPPHPEIAELQTASEIQQATRHLRAARVGDRELIKGDLADHLGKVLIMHRQAVRDIGLGYSAIDTAPFVGQLTRLLATLAPPADGGWSNASQLSEQLEELCRHISGCLGSRLQGLLAPHGKCTAFDQEASACKIIAALTELGYMACDALKDLPTMAPLGVAGERPRHVLLLLGNRAEIRCRQFLGHFIIAELSIEDFRNPIANSPKWLHEISQCFNWALDSTDPADLADLKEALWFAVADELNTNLTPVLEHVFEGVENRRIDIGCLGQDAATQMFALLDTADLRAWTRDNLRAPLEARASSPEPVCFRQYLEQLKTACRRQSYVPGMTVDFLSRHAPLLESDLRPFSGQHITAVVDRNASMIEHLLSDFQVERLMGRRRLLSYFRSESELAAQVRYINQRRRAALLLAELGEPDPVDPEALRLLNDVRRRFTHLRSFLRSERSRQRLAMLDSAPLADYLARDDLDEAELVLELWSRFLAKRIHLHPLQDEPSAVDATPPPAAPADPAP